MVFTRALPRMARASAQLWLPAARRTACAQLNATPAYTAARGLAMRPTRVLLSTDDGKAGAAAADPLADFMSKIDVEDTGARVAPQGYSTNFDEEHSRLTEVMSDKFDSDGWAAEIANQTSHDIDEVTLPLQDTYHKAHVTASYNNTKITIADADGATVTWASCGSVGFKGAKRSTSFAAQTAGQRAAQLAVEKGVSAIRVLVKGLGAGRMTSIKGLQMGGLNVVSITDTTPIPHNGCRPKKARRL